MPSSNKRRIELINMLCRICAKEDSNSIPIFGEDGKKRNLIGKIQTCLPVTVHENDWFPKQICLACLTKLDSFWDMHVLCKEAQIKIERKFYSLKSKENSEQAHSVPILDEDANCGVCKREVRFKDMGVGCEGPCQKWFHSRCINMSDHEYFELTQNPNKTWICMKCKNRVLRTKIGRSSIGLSIEEKLRGLSENSAINYGESAVIFLKRERVPSPPPPPPPATITGEPQMLPQPPGEPVIAPIAYIAPATALATAPATSSPQPVYPQTLIQVPQEPATEQPVSVYQNIPVATQVASPISTPVAAVATPTTVPRRRDRDRGNVPQPMASPAPPPAPAPSPAKRQKTDANKESSDRKLCCYCNKYFTDDIIDHHVSLHLRQSFRTCLECGKNFRSEEAMQRHRCGDKKDNETIDLDADDDDELIIL